MVDPKNPVHLAIIESADDGTISALETMALLEATNRPTKTRTHDMLDDGHNLQGDRVQYRAYKEDRKQKKDDLKEAFKSLPKEKDPTLKGKAKKALQTSLDIANDTAIDLTDKIDRAYMNMVNKANMGRGETQVAREKSYKKYLNSKQTATIALSAGTIAVANTVLMGPFQVAFDAAFALNCPELKEITSQLKKKAKEILKSAIPDKEKKEKYNTVIIELDKEVNKYMNPSNMTPA